MAKGELCTMCNRVHEPGKCPVVKPIMTGDDPWRHRSEGMRCKTCMWFTTKMYNIGRCRRRAPTMDGYPVVFEADWCGDHKLNEENQL